LSDGSPTGTRGDALRIANSSGFYGDRFDAPREMLEGGPIDVLTGDYLAELTLLILVRDRAKDASRGYARTFLRQMEDCLGTAVDRGVRIVTNAGGLNPAELADRLRELAVELGVDPTIAHIEGDDLTGRLDGLQREGHRLAHLGDGRPFAEAGQPALAANAYLGSWGIVEALAGGADVVVCPRVTDAALVIGPAAWHFGWGRGDWDELAGALVAGHVIECGAQATGGNYSFFREVPGLTHPGFPIAEVHRDGSSVITKHDGTGGLVSIGTVTAQLLYEIAGPRYVSPDVVARFDSIELAEEAADRVRISGVRGEPPPDQLKVALNYLGGFRNQMSFVLTGLDLQAKAELIRATLEEHFDLGAFDEVDIRMVGAPIPDAVRNDDATAEFRMTVKSSDAEAVGRAFSRIPVELALASYPGFTMTRPPEDATPFGVFWPTLVPKSEVTEIVVLDGAHHRRRVEQTVAGGDVSTDVDSDTTVAAPGDAHDTRDVPLGTITGARSGDKGGDANLGVWVRSDEEYAWLSTFLTVERLKELIPEAQELTIRRYLLPNLRAMNFVISGLLGEGVSSSVRPDPQAKGLGEFLRARIVPVPVGFLPEEADALE
jgi:hypothetical protein